MEFLKIIIVSLFSDSSGSSFVVMIMFFKFNYPKITHRKPRASYFIIIIIIHNVSDLIKKGNGIFSNTHKNAATKQSVFIRKR